MRIKRYRAVALFIGFSLVVFLIVVSLINIPPPPPSVRFFDKVEHVGAYAVLALWFGYLYAHRWPYKYFLAFFFILGVVLEYIQEFIPYRVCSWQDILANVIGILAGTLLAYRIFRR
jgi:VanZ family protein